MEIPGYWEMRENKLVREWKFADFPEALRFINRVAEVAEELNHHPEIWNSYATVRLSLSTHDEGGRVTEKDIALAERINNI